MKKEIKFFFIFKLLIGFILSTSLFFLIIKDSSLKSLLFEINKINKIFLAISLLLFSILLIIKAWRWKIITKLDNLYLRNFSIYYLFSHLLPCNTGEIFKLTLFKKQGKSYSELFGNIFLERIYDIFSFLPLIIIILIFYKNFYLEKYFFILFLIIFGLLVVYYFFYKKFKKNNFIIRILDKFHAGFMLKKIHLKTHLCIALLSLLIRFITIISICYCLLAVNFDNFIFISSIVLCIINSFTFIIPSGFGGLGLVQTSTLFSFLLIFNNLVQQKELYKTTYQKILLTGHILWLTPLISITFLIIILSIINLIKKISKINNHNQ